jgi:hypothetical protein
MLRLMMYLRYLTRSHLLFLVAYGLTFTGDISPCSPSGPFSPCVYRYACMQPHKVVAEFSSNFQSVPVRLFRTSSEHGYTTIFMYSGPNPSIIIKKKM